MAKQFLLTIPDDTYHMVSELADKQDGDIEQLLLEAIQQQVDPFPPDERHNQMELEIAAYQQPHPELVKLHSGQYVCIYEGKVVDTAAQLATLAKRLEQAYPHEVVLVRKLEATPERLIHAHAQLLCHM